RARTALIAVEATAASLSAGAFGLVEVPVLRVEVELGPDLAALGGQTLGLLDAAHEAAGGHPQRHLPVDLRTARPLSRPPPRPAPEPVARPRRSLPRGSRLPPPACTALVQPAELVVEAGHRARQLGILEPHRPRALLHLPSMQERRQRLRDVVEDPLASLLLA